jgi:putative mycofactocin binding protein MftB
VTPSPVADTAATAPPAPPALDPGRAYALHPQVALRPEPFGALAYHYGTRRLVFLRSPAMVALVRSLAEHPTLGAALDAAVADGVITARQRASHQKALGSLLASDILREREREPS